MNNILISLLLFQLSALSAPPPLKFTDLGYRIQMENGDIQLEIDKKNGRIIKIIYQGDDVLGNGGSGYMQSYDANGFFTPGPVDMIIAQHDENVLDIGFSHRNSEFSIDYEFHYVLRPNESGFHNYIVYGYDAEKDSRTERLRLSQLNYALRLDGNVYTHFYDGNTSGMFPSLTEMKNSEKVMDATYRLSNGDVYTKYGHSALMDETHLLHGLMGQRHGAWIMMPTHEYLNATPIHSELTVHQGADTPLMLRHVQAGHQGVGSAFFSREEGSWEKWGGPWFFYFNKGGEMSDRLHDAQEVAEKLRNEWPFQWITDPRFSANRGRLTGCLLDENGKPVENARVVITQAAKGEKPGKSWPLQWRGYRFFGWTDDQGCFDIKDIWPDQYDLYAVADEVSGYYAKYDLEILPGETADSGPLIWQMPPRGQLLWQIGTLDRSGKGFGFSEQYREWGLWLKIQEKFPDGIIVYDADQNKTDELPFILAAYMKADETPYQPVLKIEFTVPETQTLEGNASLLLALADAIQHGSYPFVDVSLVLNGQPLATIQEKFQHGGAIHRSGIRGHCQEEEVSFPASLLNHGKNVFEIHIVPCRTPRTSFIGAPYIAIMFDAIRLEIFE